MGVIHNVPSIAPSVLSYIHLFHRGYRRGAAAHSLRVVAKSDSRIGVTGKLGDQANLSTCCLEIAYERMSCAVGSDIGQAELGKNWAPI